MSSKGSKIGFWEWIGLNTNPDYSQARHLGTAIGAALMLLVLVLALGGIATLFQFLILIFQSDADHEAIRNIGLVVAAILGAPFVLWRALVAQKQADTAEQSHITDQINKAVSGLGAQKTLDRIGRPVKIYTGATREYTQHVEIPEDFRTPSRSVELRRYRDFTIFPDGREFDGLHIELKNWERENTEIEWQNNPLEIKEGEAIGGVGDWVVFSETLPNIEVRIGAIYALERIAQDSQRDHRQVMEILCAYIRENSRVRSLVPSEPPFNRPRPRSDVQSALDVIGRRTSEHVALEHSQKYRLDLRNVDLSGADFSKGNFEGAIFSGSRLEASIFRNTNLRAARLQGCLLNFAEFFDADLCGAIIDHAVINKSDGIGSSIAMAKNMRGLSMAGADISAIRSLPEEGSLKPTFGTKDTKLTPHLELRREKLSEEIEQFCHLTAGGEIDRPDEVTQKLQATAFQYWSPYDSNDLLTDSFRAKLWDHLSLKGFPFRDN